MEENKKSNWFLNTLLVVFIIYFSLYLMDNLGYYNIQTKNKVITEQKMKEFESDIKNGKKIDIKEYVKDDNNYNNIYSNIGYESSLLIDNILNKGFKNIGKVLKKLFIN